MSMSASEIVAAPPPICQYRGERGFLTCARQDAYGEYDGESYCVLHFPGPDKTDEFQEALKGKLSSGDFDFRGVWFPDKCHFAGYKFDQRADFTGATFNREADFTHAIFLSESHFASAEFRQRVIFQGATFNLKANFLNAKFGSPEEPAVANFMGAKFGQEADFRVATFSEEAAFGGCEFSGAAKFGLTRFLMVASFPDTRFESADFRSAVFLGGHFHNARFRDSADFSFAELVGPVTFYEVRFMSSVRFSGRGKRRLWPPNMGFKDIEVVRPEHAHFHDLILRPSFFAGADVRKFTFTSVEWRVEDIREEIRSLKDRGFSSPHKFLETACQRLAVNSEENQRYQEASTFRYLAMEARRLERWRGFACWRLDWWYWFTSGYGERVLRAFVVLLGVWFIFAMLYTQAGFVRWEPRMTSESDAAAARRDEQGAPLNLPDALSYSLNIVTLQKLEPRPATTSARWLVTLETMLGPLQVTLLALAIRRKFMR